MAVNPIAKGSPAWIQMIFLKDELLNENVELPDDFDKGEIPSQCHSLLLVHKILDDIENQRKKQGSPVGVGE